MKRYDCLKVDFNFILDIISRTEKFIGRDTGGSGTNTSGVQKGSQYCYLDVRVKSFGDSETCQKMRSTEDKTHNMKNVKLIGKGHEVGWRIL